MKDDFACNHNIKFIVFCVDKYCIIILSMLIMFGLSRKTCEPMTRTRGSEGTTMEPTGPTFFSVFQLAFWDAD